MSLRSLNQGMEGNRSQARNETTLSARHNWKTVRVNIYHNARGDARNDKQTGQHMKFAYKHSVGLCVCLLPSKVKSVKGEGALCPQPPLASAPTKLSHSVSLLSPGLRCDAQDASVKQQSQESLEKIMT